MSLFSGNVTLANLNVLAQPSQWEASNSLTAILIALLIAIISTALRSPSDDKIHKLQGFHLVTASKFFSKRYDFFRENFKKTGVKMFRFSLLQHRVIAVAGEANRKIFFNDRSLGLIEGYRILVGGIPSIKHINRDTGEISELIKRLALLLRRERINEVLPALFEDVDRKMKDWGTEGKINPFNEVYDLVFQMTVRMASCKELAEDREAIARIDKHFNEIDTNGTLIPVLLPWFPGSAKRARKKATQNLYNLFLSFITLRRKASTPSNDPIDLFISQGLSDDSIIQTIMSIIFAGVANTGLNASWALFHLGTNPEWKLKAINECKGLVDRYTNTTSSDPLYARLSTIPMSAWEEEAPSMETIVRETLRISGSGTLFRRNIEKDIHIGEATIKRGDFLTYSLAEANLNPDIYTNPMTFDPDRYGPGREEDRKEALSYLPWGAGRHPCAGMRIAKLEMKLILAMVLLGCEYELVDGNGNYPKALPVQDRNDLMRSRPMGEPCYLKFKRIVE
jgi:sterol 14-demethylase